MANRNIKITIKKNKNEVSKEAARIISQSINKKPSLVLGLATGKTMIPVYKELLNLYKKKKISFKKVRTFNLDEYYNIDDKNSFRYYMDKNLFNKVDINKKNINFLKEEKDGKNYEEKIKNLPIDLQILGIGINGHIGFNEPGSSIKSKTRKVKLSESTIKTNSRFFKSKKIPRYALTMGIGTIMKAKRIILIATGKEKSSIIKKTLDKTNKNIPASILNKHSNVEFLLDSQTAKSIKFK